MATRSYNENGIDTAVEPHGHYDSNTDINYVNNGADQSEVSDHGEQPRYLSQLARGRAANFFVNGDVFFPARKIVYNPKHFRDFTHYMDYLTDKLEPRFGAVRKICTPHHGHRIRELRDLQENGAYVVAGKERFKPYQYEQIMSHEKKRAQPLNYNSDPAHLNRQYVTSGRIKKCETQSILIKVWPNGGDLTGPRRVLLTPRVRPFTLPNVMSNVNEILKADCVGTVEKLYFLTGAQVSDIDQITHNGQYVACRRTEKFKRAQYREHGTKNLSTTPRPERKLLAPLFPRPSNSMYQSSPEQSNTSTQSSVNSNSHRRRAPIGDDRVFHARPLKQSTSSERTSIYDLDKDQGGIFKARQNNRNTHGARPVLDSKDTKTDLPVDQWEAKVVEDYQHRNGYPYDSRAPVSNNRGAKQARDRRPDVYSQQREHSPDRVKGGYGYKKHKDLRTTKLPEPRQYSSESRLEEDDKAAAKIQSAYRGHQTRKELRSPKPPDVPKQIKPNSYDDRLEEYDNVVTKIQAAYRGHQTRGELTSKKSPEVPRKNIQKSSGNRLEDVDSAATKIQAAYRGHQTRKELRSPKSPKPVVPRQNQHYSSGDRLKEEDVAAAKIQSAYRGHMTRKNLGRNQTEAERSSDESVKNRAATKIQANYRGFQQRKSTGSKSVRREDEAAAKIQAGFRGYQSRKQLESQQSMREKEKAATKIQAGFHGYQTRKQIADQNAAAAKIQSGYRGHLARKNVGSPQKKSSDQVWNEEDKAAAKIQAGYRGHMARKQIPNTRQRPVRENSYEELDKENGAAVTIQSHYRGYLARKEYAEHRAAASNDKYWP